MADTPIASTIVAAVLETTGYVTQSNILDAFTPFWGAAGTFFYTLSSIGAIMSVMIFGSYRYARYLIIGPSLFWFLIGNRVDVPPTQWKLGGGNSVSVEKEFTKTAVEAYDPVAHPPRLPWFFAYYTKAIDDVMNGLVNVVLSHENDQDLMFQTRNHMLDFLLNVGPNNDEVYRLFGEGLFDDCSTMSNYATALSDKRFSDLHTRELIAWQGLGFTEAPTELAKLATEKAALQDAYAKASQRTIQAGPITREFIRRQVMKQIGGVGGFAPVIDQGVDNGSHPITHQNYVSMLAPAGTTPDQFIKKELGNLTLTCGQMWGITEHAIIEHSKEIIEKANVMHLQGNLADTAANRDMMCREIAMKMSRDWNKFEGGGSNCDLVEVVSVFMFKTAIERMPLSEKIKQKKERMALVGRTDELMAVDDINNPDRNKSLITSTDGKALKVKLNELGQTIVRDSAAEARNGDGKEVWRPFVTINIESFSDVAFGHQQRTMARNLQQGIYSYAMNLPYYQGVLLYLLSLAYPFMCLLVIIPSRAMSFLLCPLMWLWVKSWDVGFAVVIILDKVLWNLLPSTDVPLQPFSGDPSTLSGVVTAAAGESSRLPEILNSALSVDPSYHILAHFNFVSIALMSVPAFTGFAILKARSSILASFTEGPRQAANEAGDMAFSAYNTNTSNIQRDKLHRYSGAALQASADWGSGLAGDGRLRSGFQWGGAKALANSISGPSEGIKRGLSHRPSAQIGKELDQVTKKIEKAGGSASPALKSRLGELKTEKARAESIEKAKSPEGIKKALRDQSFKMWEAMEKGVNTGFDMMLAEQAATARDNWAFHPDLGFFGYYSNRMRGVISGTDGTGGFELEDIDVAKEVTAAEFNLQWKRVDSGFEIAGDVLGNLFGGALEVATLGDKKKQNAIGNLGGLDLINTDSSVEQAFGGASDVGKYLDMSTMEIRRKDEEYKKQWEIFFGKDYEQMREEREREEEDIRKKEKAKQVGNHK